MEQRLKFMYVDGAGYGQHQPDRSKAACTRRGRAPRRPRRQRLKTAEAGGHEQGRRGVVFVTQTAHQRVRRRQGTDTPQLLRRKLIYMKIPLQRSLSAQYGAPEEGLDRRQAGPWDFALQRDVLVGHIEGQQRGAEQRRRQA